MTPLILALTLFKISIPFIEYLTYRIFEYRTYKKFMREFGMSEAKAKEEAKFLWRDPPSRLKGRLFGKFRNKTKDSK